MVSSSLVLNPADVESFSSPIHSRGFHHGSGPRMEVIQIYLATLGSNSTVLPMRVFSSDTVASVKLRIQAFKGFYTNQQRLVHGGRELIGENRRLVEDCGVGSGEVVHLVLRLSDVVDVNVETVTGKKYAFKVCRNQQVKYLKERISEEGGLALEEQQLVFNGERLDDEKRIRHLCTEDNVVILLVVKRSAKVRSRSLGKDIELSVTAAEVDSLTDDRSPPDIDIEECASGDHIDTSSAVRSCLVPSSDVTKLETVAEPVPIKEHIWYGPALENVLLEPVRDFVVAETPDSLLKVLQGARSGLQVGHAPVLTSQGSGGTYFMKDSGCRNVGVFKPVDEEPEAVNNPRSSSRSNSLEGLKSGTRVGEGAIREVAAFLLDHPLSGCRTLYGRNEQGFAGVPPTMMVRTTHQAFNYASDDERKTKTGSLQQYIHSVSNCEDMGPANFPVDDVHKISILDMRLANTDRNGGNILICKQTEASTLKLVPIDHGYCLPDKFEDCTFEWLYWPQAKVPFDPLTLKYIAALDADQDISILTAHGIVLRHECARVLRVATMLLKKGAAAGLTPFDIGFMMSREQFDKKSEIEIMLETAEASVTPTATEDVFMDCLSVTMNQHLREKL